MANEDECFITMNHEEETFLPGDGNHTGIYSRDSSWSFDGLYGSRAVKHGVIWAITALNIMFLMANIWFSITHIRRNPSLLSVPKSTFYSPAQEALIFELRPVDGHVEESIYGQPPSPESDAAWGRLMEGTNLKISPEELFRLNQTSIPMRDKSGYLAVLGVYHELHCIKRLRKWFHRHYYYPNTTELEYIERQTHADHCIEFLRQAAMCHRDVTVTSFKWLHDAQGRAVEPTTQEGAPHQCVRWDKLSAWAESRRVDLYDSSLLEPEAS